jgi:hypothetical protein
MHPVAVDETVPCGKVASGKGGAAWLVGLAWLTPKVRSAAPISIRRRISDRRCLAQGARNAAPGAVTRWIKVFI